MKYAVKIVLLAACAFLTVGQSCEEVFDCDQFWPAITVWVIDKETGVTVPQATVTATDEAGQVEILSECPSGREGVTWYCGVYSPGVYSVMVTADGYEDLLIADVQVPAGRQDGQCYLQLRKLVEMVTRTEDTQ